MTRIFHWFFMWKMDPMSGFDIRLVFTLPPRDSTLQYKRCVHFWNNFPCITSLYILTRNSCLMRQNALKQYTLSLTKICIMISFIFTKLLSHPKFKKITGVSLSFDPTSCVQRRSFKGIKFFITNSDFLTSMSLRIML